MQSRTYPSRAAQKRASPEQEKQWLSNTAPDVNVVGGMIPDDPASSNAVAGGSP